MRERRSYVIAALIGLAGASSAGCAASVSAPASSVRAFGSARGDRHEARRANTRIITANTVAPRVAASTSQSAAQSVERSASAPASDGVDERTVSVAGTEVQAGVAVGEFSAPFPVVAAALQDWASYRQFLPRLSESRVVRRRRNESDVYLRADLLDGFGALWVLARFRVTRATGSIVVEGQRLDGTLQRFDVRIEATEVPSTGRTRVAVQMLGLPPFPLPSGYLSRQHGRWTGRSFRALRDRVEAIGRSAAAPQAPR